MKKHLMIALFFSPDFLGPNFSMMSVKHVFSFHASKCIELEDSDRNSASKILLLSKVVAFTS